MEEARSCIKMGQDIKESLSKGRSTGSASCGFITETSIMDSLKKM
jgi:hypothetical protein